MTKLIALQLLSLGCLAVYLSAKQQVLIKKKLAKNLAWSIFTACLVIASVLLAQLYTAMHAACFVVGVIMFMWIVLALWAPHSRNIKIISFAITGSMLFLSIFGVGYVG